jgi:hypothetical protein
MKNYFNLSPFQRAILKQEDLPSFFAAHLMEQGLVMPKAPAEPTLLKIDAKTTLHYQVVSNYTPVLVCKTIAEAEKAMKLVSFRADYDYGFGSDNRYAVPNDNLKIEQVELWTREDFNKIKSIIKANFDIQKEYDNLLAEYNKTVKEIDTICDEIRSDYLTQVREHNAKLTLLDTFEEFIATADDNADIALKFLRKRYSDEEIQSALDWFEFEGLTMTRLREAFASTQYAADNILLPE